MPIKLFKKVVILLVYKCENPECGFLFSREGEIYTCPVCGKPNIIPASSEDIERFRQMLEVDQNR